MSLRLAKSDTRSDTERIGGFVLIEVLVAVGVAGIIMVALMRAFLGIWSNISMVREEAEAMWTARGILFTLGPRGSLAEGTQNGVIGRYRWAVEIRKVPDAAPAPPPRRSEPLGSPTADGEPETKLWSTFRIVVVLTAPSGRSTSLETIRLGQPGAR